MTAITAARDSGYKQFWAVWLGATTDPERADGPDNMFYHVVITRNGSPLTLEGFFNQIIPERNARNRLLKGGLAHFHRVSIVPSDVKPGQDQNQLIYGTQAPWSGQSHPSSPLATFWAPSYGLLRGVSLQLGQGQPLSHLEQLGQPSSQQHRYSVPTQVYSMRRSISRGEFELSDPTVHALAPVIGPGFFYPSQPSDLFIADQRLQKKRVYAAPADYEGSSFEEKTITVCMVTKDTFQELYREGSCIENRRHRLALSMIEPLFFEDKNAAAIILTWDEARGFIFEKAPENIESLSN